MAAKPEEIAELRVGGKIFRDWKTVSVWQGWIDSHHLFEFTATEKTDKEKVGFWASDQFRPGQEVTVYLAGHLAITGYITERQVGMDANIHGVKLVGKTKTSDVAKASVVTKNGNFDNQSWAQIARKILSDYNVKLSVVGNIDETPFKNVQVNPGELAFSFLERLARSKGIILGSDEHGNQVAIGDHSSPVSDSLVEGVNILRANCSIKDDFTYKRYIIDGQMHGSDEAYGGMVAQQRAEIAGTEFRRDAAILTPMEQPGPLAEVQKRAKFEAQWRDGSTINCIITVQGWLRGGYDLWRIGSAVHVKSPMLILDMDLAIQTATFTQGPDGTLTELELVKPGLLNGKSYGL